MESIPWYQSAILRQQIVQVLVALTALIGINTEAIDLDKTITSIFAGIAGVVAIWTFITRLVKPSPNLTAAAANKEQDLIERGKLPAKQGGFARIGVLLVLAIGAITAISVLPACSSTRAAYQVADTLEERAYVATEHYAALVRQAADLRERGILTGAALTRVQEVETVARPVVLKLGSLVRAFKAAKTAESELELQLALDESVRLIADLVRAIKGETP